MLNYEVTLSRKTMRKVLTGLITVMICLSTFHLQGMSIKAAEGQADEEYGISAYSENYDHYYTAATSDPKKVYFTTNVVNVNLNSSSYPAGYVSGDPKIARTIPYLKGLKFRVGNTAIAKVEDGWLIPQKIGKTYLYVETYNKLTAKVLVNVVKEEERLPLYIGFTKTSTQVALNKTISIYDYAPITVSPGDATKKVTYSIGNSKVATVTKDGKIKGISKGSTWLYAKSPNGVENRMLIQVVNNTKVKSIKIPDKITVTQGNFTQVSYTMNPTNGYTGNISWRVGNPKIAKVNASGQVSGISEGSTYLYAKPNGGTEVKCLVKVIDRKKPAKMVISQDKLNLYSHLEENFYFYDFIDFYNADGKEVYYDLNNVKVSVGNKKIANIKNKDNYGITLKAGTVSGNTWLNIETKEGLKGRILISVDASGPSTFKFTSNIKVNKAQAVKAKDYIELKNSINDSDDDYYENYYGKDNITYRIGNQKIAKMDGGYVVAESAGNTYLYATYRGKTIKTLVTVQDGSALKSISFNKSSVNINVKKNWKENVQITLKPTNTIMTYVAFTVGNDKIAHVDQYGNIEGLRNGNTYVYATGQNGVSSRILVRVTGYDEVKSIKMLKKLDINLNSENRDKYVDIELDTSFASDLGEYQVYAGNKQLVDVSFSSYGIGNMYSDWSHSVGQKKFSIKVHGKGKGNTYVYVKAPNGVVSKMLVQLHY